MKYFVDWGGATKVVEILARAEGVQVLVDGVPHAAEVAVVPGTGLMSLLLDGESFSLTARFESGVAVLGFHDREVRVPVEDERTHEAKRLTGGTRKAAGKGEIRSVMPGVVKELRVHEGAKVAIHQALLILEAMKMENEIRSDREATVAKVHVTKGQAVEKGALLVSFTD